MTRQVNIGIGEEDRVAICEGLSRLLADTYTLYLTSHNFHWNVTGPMFNSLHAMFMTQYTELWNAIDPIAERIRSLGQPAPGSYAQFAKLSSLPDAPRGMKRPPARRARCSLWSRRRATSRPRTCSPNGSACMSRPHGCCAPCSKSKTRSTTGPGRAISARPGPLANCRH